MPPIRQPHDLAAAAGTREDAMVRAPAVPRVERAGPKTLRPPPRFDYTAATIAARGQSVGCWPHVWIGTRAVSG